MNTESKQEAIEMFGKQKVDEVISIVEMSDADMAFSTFEDQDDDDACSIIEMLYFEND
jgi:hypothetical protein